MLLLFFALVVSSNAQSAPIGVGQATDWLVQDTCNVSTTAVMKGNVLTLSNGLISRSFLTSPAFCTIEYLRLTPAPLTFLRGLTPEGNVTLNSSNFNIGGCLGVPHGHGEFWDPETYLDSLKPDPEGFTFQSYVVSKPELPFPWVPGTRYSPSNLAWPPKGLHLTVTLAPPTSANFTAFAGVLATVHYEMYDCVPAMQKWIEIHNDSPKPVVVNNISTELLRVPNGFPELMSVMSYMTSQAPWDSQLGYPGFAMMLWNQDPDFDDPDDNELHVSWTYYTYLNAGYNFDTAFGGPLGPGLPVPPKNTLKGLSWKTVLHDSYDLERQGLGLKRFLRVLAPQVYESPMTMMTTNINSTEQVRYVLSQAASVGLDFVIVAFGAQGFCGLCDAQLLNETWRSWFAQQVAYAKSVNVTMSVYTLMQHNGWGETVPPGENAVNRDGSINGPACMATDWHARYRQNVLDFIQNVSLGGLETDGQYEGYPCAEEHGDHRHNGVNGSFHAQLVTTLDFNVALKKLGVYQTSADSYVFSGTNRWNHADNDAGFQLPFWEYLSMGRNYCYDSTYTRVPTSGQYAIQDMTRTTFDNCGGYGLARMQCLNFALGSFIVSGTFPYNVADVLWTKNDQDAPAISKIYGQWFAFYKKYRPLFGTDLFLHVAPVTSRSLEVTLHSRRNCHKQDPCLLVGLVNPTSSAMTQVVPVSVYYSGVRSGATVTVVDVTPTRPGEALSKFVASDFVVGAKAGAYEILVPVNVGPRDFQALLLSVKLE